MGNRAIGDRPSQNLTAGQLAVKAALALGSPYTAMLFMGEEWASSSPFQFFSSHPEPELARATAEGRKKEFAEHGWDADDIPDPQDPETFQRSKLNWDEAEHGDHALLRAFYRDLIALRRNEPDFADPWLDNLRIDYDEDARWFVMRRGALSIVCNLGETARRRPGHRATWCWRGVSPSPAPTRRGWADILSWFCALSTSYPQAPPPGDS